MAAENCEYTKRGSPGLGTCVRPLDKFTGMGGSRSNFMAAHHAPTPPVARHVFLALNALCITAVTVAASLVVNVARTRSKDASGAGTRSPDRSVRAAFVTFVYP